MADIILYPGETTATNIRLTQLLPNRGAGLIGQSIHVEGGIVRADVHIDSFQGTAVVNMDVPLVGAAITSATGTIDCAETSALLGAFITSGQGSVSVASNDVTEALTGSVSTGGLTEPTAGSTVPLAGSESTLAQGTLTAQISGDASVELTGQAIAASLTAPGVSHTLAADGLESPSGQGDLISGLGLTGQVITCGQSVFGTMGGTYVTGGDGTGIRRPLRYAQTLVTQYRGPRRRR